MWITALQDAASDGYNPTNITTSQSGNGNNADVRVIIGAIQSGFAAYVSCPADAVRTGTDPTERCWNQFLKVDTGGATGFNTTARRKKLMCHEFGHTLGLRHTNATGTCMRQGPSNETMPGTHAHFVHINSNY